MARANGTRDDVSPALHGEARHPGGVRGGVPSVRSVLSWFGRHPYVTGIVFYTAFAAIVFREGGLGSSASFPQGTNALNEWLVVGFYQRNSSAMWLYPFTDWGQPYGGFTGPTVLWPAIALLNPTVTVRAIEFGSFVVAGLAMMVAVRAVGGTTLGALVGGFYYSLFAETPEFFEGHVSAMISVALGPAFIILLWRFLRAPTLRTGILPALLLYLLISIGDLGVLYFYVFFAVLLAGYAIVGRQFSRRYSVRELAAIVASVALVSVLSISWLYPYLAGVRPQYTTGITVQVVPFAQTEPENLVYSFSGFVQDSSFIHFTYGQFAFGPWGSDLLPLSLLIPAAVTVYAFVGRHRDRILFYASGLLALLFSTGNLYPGLSQFNSAVYYHVPYFDSIPELPRWVEYTLVVFGVLLGRLVSDLQLDSRNGYPRVAALWDRVSRGWRPADLGDSNAVRTRAPRALLASPAARRAGIAAVVVAITALVVAQNVAVVTEPPATFQFPAEYTASLSYLSHHPLSGEVLEVPFGAIYERTPWGGVSGSSQLLEPQESGADADVFEAGTPYSLAMDTFVSNGITYGGSRNMTKFLGSANVQYIVATDYPDWNYSSSAISPSLTSYDALANETGLGPVTNVSPIQSVYVQDNSAGNLSFHPSYLLYFGPDSTLYSVLDSPWYTGPSMALVNGSTVGPLLSEYISHAAGIVVAPASILTLGVSVIDQARAYRVPIIEVVPPSQFKLNGTQVRPDAWNATGGQDLQFDRSNAPAEIDLAANLLAAAGYTNLTLSGQFSAPPGSSLSISLGNTSYQLPWTGSNVLTSLHVNDSAPGYFLAGEDNRTINSSRFVAVTTQNGTTFVNWTPSPNASNFQYLELGLHNLSGWNGFAVDVARIPATLPQKASGLPLEGRISYGGSSFDLPAYPTIVPTDPSISQYRFLFPSGGYGMPADLRKNLENFSYLQIGLPSPGFNGSLVLSNLTLLDVSTPPLSPATIGNIPATATNLTVSLAPTGRLGFLEVSTGAYPVPRPYDRDVLPQPGPTDLSISPAATGWGIVSLAQTYSTFWQLSGSGSPAPAVVDVGLTGWLVNSTAGAEWHVTYLGDSLERTSLELEAVAVPVVAIPLALMAWRPPALSRRFGGGRAP
jgi:hypothetical protein